MLKPLRYFFFRIYDWKRGSESEPMAVFTALASTTVAVYMHILAIHVFLSRATKLNVGLPHDRNTSRAVGIIVGLGIMTGFYRAWIASSRYRKFVEEFRSETEMQRGHRTVLLILYAVVSFLLPFTLMILLRP